MLASDSLSHYISNFIKKNMVLQKWPYLSWLWSDFQNSKFGMLSTSIPICLTSWTARATSRARGDVTHACDVIDLVTETNLGNKIVLTIKKHEKYWRLPGSVLKCPRLPGSVLKCPRLPGSVLKMRALCVWLYQIFWGPFAHYFLIHKRYPWRSEPIFQRVVSGQA